MGEPRKNFRANEEEYFRKQDAELIARIKSEREQKKLQEEVEQHKRHCSGCGSETIDATEVYKKEFDDDHRDLWTGVQVCLSCHHVAFPMPNLKKLIHTRDGKLQILDLEINLGNASRGTVQKKSA